MSPNPGAGERAEAALLADPRRSNNEIAAEVDANVNPVIASAGAWPWLALYRPMPEQPMIRAGRELRSDPARSDLCPPSTLAFR